MHLMLLMMMLRTIATAKAAFLLAGFPNLPPHHLPLHQLLNLMASPHPTPPLHAKRQGIIRSKNRRRTDRLKDQKPLKRVSKKRVAEAMTEIFQVGYIMSSNPSFTQPGWIGKHNAGMPSRPFTLMEVVKDYQLTHFPWDGV
jgi:hypothetical protein